MEYKYKKQLKISFEEALLKIEEELSKEGFGILTKIDVKETLKKKLNVDFDRYVILGACNPQFAYQALQEERDIGLLLPCNVIVYEKDRNIFISTILPTIAMNMVESTKLARIAKEVELKLKKVIDNI